ncbi:hypothetical protein Tco_0690931, partial [Tanacetum coccineum]
GVTETVAFGFKIELIPVSGEGLMNLDTKSDGAEELCSCTTGGLVVRVT